MATHALRAATLPKLERTVFMLCDIQERFRPLIHRFDDVIHTAATLVRPQFLAAVRALLHDIRHQCVARGCEAAE